MNKNEIINLAIEPISVAMKNENYNDELIQEYIEYTKDLISDIVEYEYDEDTSLEEIALDGVPSYISEIVMSNMEDEELNFDMEEDDSSK